MHGSYDDGGMLMRGQLFPHVKFRRLDGTLFRYADVWQRQALVLVCLGAETDNGIQTDGACAADLAAHEEAFQQYDAAVAVTREKVKGVPFPGAIVVDRWGEVVTVEAIAAANLVVDDLLAWARFVAMACPECEGEVR